MAPWNGPNKQDYRIPTAKGKLYDSAGGTEIHREVVTNDLRVTALSREDMTAAAAEHGDRQ